MTRDIHADITARICDAIESGAAKGNWLKPWATSTTNGLPANASTGAAYRGINVLLLWSEGAARGYETNRWATYLQWQALGAQVRKGEKSAQIVKVGTFQSAKERATAQEGEEVRTRSYLKTYAVFNAAQVDGFALPATPRPNQAAAIAAAESFVAATGATLRHGGERAFYSTRDDFIAMPDRDRFIATADTSATENYYGTLLHELTHWTGHASRCAREFGKRFGDAAYAAEELTAELGAAFLCAELGITPTARHTSAEYIAGWLQALRSDSRAVITAAARASDAADWLRQAAAAGPIAIAA